MSALYQFSEAVFLNWFLYMTAGPFLADEVFKKACPKWRDKVGARFPVRTRRRIELAIIIFGVFYAGFAAFKEEYRARENAETALREAVRTPIPIPITETDPQARAGLDKATKRIQTLKRQLTEAQRSARDAQERAFRAETASLPK